MIEVEMSEDIRKYEPKAVGPFTLRQLICFGIAAIIAIPIAILLPLRWDNKLLVACIIVVPIALCGYIKMDGMPFEVLVLRLVYMYILTPGKRKYKRENTYRTAMKRMQKQEEQRKMAKMTPAQQKAYLRRKNRKKSIVYSKKRQFKVYH